MNRDYPLAPTPEMKNSGILAKGEKLISKEEFMRRQKEKLVSSEPVSVTKDGDVTSYRYAKAKTSEPPIKPAAERIISRDEFKKKQERKEIEPTPSSVTRSAKQTTMRYRSTAHKKIAKKK